MSDLSVTICTIGISGWYPRGVARMINEFQRVSPGYRIAAWVNATPAGGAYSVVVDGYDYTAYCSKPHAMQRISRSCDIGLWLDASFYPVKHISPLIDYVATRGFYAAPDGFAVGEWASDHALDKMGVTRDQAMKIPGMASGCVGMDFRRPENVKLVNDWRDFAWLIPGAHTNDNEAGRKWGTRNVGHVSDDPRCCGHRHDQTVLSLLAHNAGITPSDPLYWDYLHVDGKYDKDTVLICDGGM